MHTMHRERWRSRDKGNFKPCTVFRGAMGSWVDIVFHENGGSNCPHPFLLSAINHLATGADPGFEKGGGDI